MRVGLAFQLVWVVACTTEAGKSYFLVATIDYLNFTSKVKLIYLIKDRLVD